jgi:S-adenosylmethionine:tRNA ribosyltransferase-isomerase
MNPGNIHISDYTYTLPEEKIARYPLPERDMSKLLLCRQGQITEDIYRNIDEYLPGNSLLVFNNTRVVEARLLFQKTSGGIIELFCLEPADEYADITEGMLQQERVKWKCLVGGASKWKPGQVLQKMISADQQAVTLEARYIAKQHDCFIIELSWTPASLSFAEVLHLAGVIPLPPYIRRPAETSDAERYQTIYAQQDGSVAAPTAGLHFTPAVFGKLLRKDVHPCFVTLHVGAGTFKPVKAETIGGHGMHAEFIDVDKNSIEQLRSFAGKIYAVGTTSARTLESLYWMGVKTQMDPAIKPEDLFISQWEVYEQLLPHDTDVPAALQSLLNWMDKNQLHRLISKTQILIAPGYPFKIIRGLITNFHQPNSTLLLLVAALTGDTWKKVYAYALEHNFRFLSYGDGCLIEL